MTFSVPMQFGVVVMLLATNTSFSLQAYIGIIMLAGIVVSNGILLVDYTNVLRRRDGLSIREAVEQAGRTRLRPILMTTLAMIFGMVPLAFALTEGSEQRAPMGQAVIGGVITSSILTLVVVPVVYAYVDDLSQWLKKTWSGRKAVPHQVAG